MKEKVFYFLQMGFIKLYNRIGFGLDFAMFLIRLEQRLIK